MSKFAIAFVGAGGVNFGSHAAPWNHASRLEILSKELSIEVVAIYDIRIEQADKVLEQRKKNSKIWENTKTFSSFEKMLEESKPQAVFIGIPPASHGEIEISCAKRGIHMFIEKPISCFPLEQVRPIQEAIESHKNLVVSVGYMLRYCKAVKFIKDTLSSLGVSPVLISARYNTAYTSIYSAVWWDKRASGGPIIEQATHFCDLARYLCGEVDLSTVSCITVPASHQLGKLTKIPANCDIGLPEEFRVPRATCATWKFMSGAIGSLNHGALLHGDRYHTEFEIWADGVKILLHDPYTVQCAVYVNDVKTEFPVDDPYLEEDRAFLETILKGGNEDEPRIKSSYSDAVKTYELSYKITYSEK